MYFEIELSENVQVDGEHSFVPCGPASECGEPTDFESNWEDVTFYFWSQSAQRWEPFPEGFNSILMIQWESKMLAEVSDIYQAEDERRLEQLLYGA